MIVYNLCIQKQNNCHKLMLYICRTCTVFSPQRGRSGQRSAWGGEIGGAGVDHHGGIGLNGAPNSLLTPKDSMLSLSSTDTVDNILLDYPSGYV